MWITSLASIEGLPPCPKDMSEPAYSALLFCRACNVSLFDFCESQYADIVVC